MCVNGIFVDTALIKSLVAEGRRIGKCPWCCDGNHEAIAFEILSNRYGIRGIEKMEETIKRRGDNMNTLKFKYKIGEEVRFKHSGGSCKFLVILRTYFDSGQGASILYELRPFFGEPKDVGINVIKAHEHELQPYVPPKEKDSEKSPRRTKGGPLSDRIKEVK